jgi:2-iminobutanoate/2-iminopropanoate deaminase
MKAIKKHVITTENAPQAIGPYSPGVHVANLVFISGQLGIDPASGKLVEGGIEAETRRAIANLQGVLGVEGVGLENVVKTTVFLRDMEDFAAMNQVYGEFFTGHHPARSTIQVAALPLGAAVEIEAIAMLGE